MVNMKCALCIYCLLSTIKLHHLDSTLFRRAGGCFLFFSAPSPLPSSVIWHTPDIFWQSHLIHDLTSSCVRAVIPGRAVGGDFDWLMIAFITCNSSLVPLLEGLCSSNPCRFDFSFFISFCRNRTDDLGINSPALWSTELVLHRLGL